MAEQQGAKMLPIKEVVKNLDNLFSGVVLNVRVGVSAIIRDADGKFLVSVRRGSHGAGTWQTPGGHLENTEGLFETAVRETKEETGLEVVAEKFITITNDVFLSEGKHYITVWVLCTMVDPTAEAETIEPDKCDGWVKKSWAELTQIHKQAERKWAEAKSKGEAPAAADGDELFLPLINLIEQAPDIDSFIASRKSLEGGPQ
ncbi:nudix domain-containing protein [Trichoderma austrokoningii]